MKYDKWTVNDEAIANYQGWTLTKDKYGGTGINRLHSVGIHRDVEETWLHVYNGFLAGDKVCKKALMIVAEESRTVFLRIKEHGEMSNTETKIE